MGPKGRGGRGPPGGLVCLQRVWLHLPLRDPSGGSRSLFTIITPAPPQGKEPLLARTMSPTLHLVVPGQTAPSAGEGSLERLTKEGERSLIGTHRTVKGGKPSRAPAINIIRAIGPITVHAPMKRMSTHPKVATLPRPSHIKQGCIRRPSIQFMRDCSCRRWTAGPPARGSALSGSSTRPSRVRHRPLQPGGRLPRDLCRLVGRPGDWGPPLWSRVLDPPDLQSGQR